MPEIIAMPLILALFASLFISVVFLFRIISAFFSPQIRQEVRSKSFLYYWMFIAIPVSIGLVWILQPWPLKIYEIRKAGRERIKNAGGWDALRKDCLILANQSSNLDSFIWINRRTNSPPLPPAIAALKPSVVLAHAEEVSDVLIPLVQIHIVGGHSTDNSWPEYWLCYVNGDLKRDDLNRIGLHSRGEEIRALTNNFYEAIR